MRGSDELKRRSHDQQISTAEHDKIAVWLFRKITNDLEFRDSIIVPNPTPGGVINEQRSGVTLEHCITNRRGEPVGFVDLMLHLQWGGDQYFRSRAYVEVKTSVNLGETIRQIKYYQSFIHYADSDASNWFVCAPTCNHVDILEANGIGFIKYDGE